jgi:type IV secretion system protein VirB7
MKSLIVILILGLLAGCSSGEDLAACKGPVFQLNTGKWDPAPSDLFEPKATPAP